MAGRGDGRVHTTGETLLAVEDLVVEFGLGSSDVVHAVRGVTFDLGLGETLGVVGESGCGKSTMARAVMQLPPPTDGSVQFAGQELTELRADQLRLARRNLQIIFQDPISSLNPRRRVRDLVAHGPRVWGEESPSAIEEIVEKALDSVGIDIAAMGDRYPTQLSGGQCQRVAIARALAMRPRLVVCDEPVSALDVSVQAQILNVLEDARDAYGLSLLFIAHDLAVVKNVSDRVLVMYLGRICELGPSETLYHRPRHHYTRLLLDSVPDPHGQQSVNGSGPNVDVPLPSPIHPPSGCAFADRCPAAEAICRTEEPVLRRVEDDQHLVACHFPAG